MPPKMKISRYLRRSERRGGKVRTIYLGPRADPVTRLLEKWEDLAHADREAFCQKSAEELQAQEQLEPVLRLLATRVTRLVWRFRQQAMQLGLKPHLKPEIRMVSHRPTSKLQVDLSQDDWAELVEDATDGDAEALEQLRQTLHRHPTLYELLGDLGRHVQSALIDCAAGESVAIREALQMQTDQLRDQLLQADPHPLERLLAEQVIATRLDLAIQLVGCHRGDLQETLHRRWERRLERAQKRHQAAVIALADVQRMLETKPAAT